MILFLGRYTEKIFTATTFLQNISPTKGFGGKRLSWSGTPGDAHGYVHRCHSAHEHSACFQKFNINLSKLDGLYKILP